MDGSCGSAVLDEEGRLTELFKQKDSAECLDVAGGDTIFPFTTKSLGAKGGSIRAALILGLFRDDVGVK